MERLFLPRQRQVIIEFGVFIPELFKIEMPLIFILAALIFMPGRMAILA